MKTLKETLGNSSSFEYFMQNTVNKILALAISNGCEDNLSLIFLCFDYIYQIYKEKNYEAIINFLKYLNDEYSLKNIIIEQNFEEIQNIEEIQNKIEILDHQNPQDTFYSYRKNGDLFNTNNLAYSNLNKSKIKLEIETEKEKNSPNKLKSDLNFSLEISTKGKVNDESSCCGLFSSKKPKIIVKYS